MNELLSANENKNNNINRIRPLLSLSLSLLFFFFFFFFSSFFLLLVLKFVRFVFAGSQYLKNNNFKMRSRNISFKTSNFLSSFEQKELIMAVLNLKGGYLCG